MCPVFYIDKTKAIIVLRAYIEARPHRIQLISLLCALSYMKGLPRERAESQQIGMDGGGSKNRDLTLDPLKRGQASQPGHGMVNRFTAAQSTATMRRWGPPAIVTLANAL